MIQRMCCTRGPNLVSIVHTDDLTASGARLVQEQNSADYRDPVAILAP